MKVLDPFPIASIFSSAYLRCVQTVEPLARARRLAIKRTESLAEGHGLNGLDEFLADAKLDHAVLSTHGDIVWELVEDLVHRRIVKAGEGGFDKGSTWVLSVDDEGPVKATYLPPP